MAPHYLTTYNSNIVALPSIQTASKDPRVRIATGYTANVVSTGNTPMKEVDAATNSAHKAAEVEGAEGRVEMGKISNVHHVRAGYVANLAGNRTIPKITNKLVAPQRVQTTRKSQPIDAENYGAGPAPFSTTTHTHFPSPQGHVVQKQALVGGGGVGEVTFRAAPGMHGVVSGFARNMLPPLECAREAAVSTSNQDLFKLPSGAGQARSLAPGVVVQRLAEPNARGGEAAPEPRDAQPAGEVDPKVLQRLRRHHPLEFEFLNKPNSVGVSVAHSQSRPVERRVLERINFHRQDPPTAPFGGEGDSTVLGVDAPAYASSARVVHRKMPLHLTSLDKKLEPKLVLASAYSRSVATGCLGGEASNQTTSLHPSVERRLAQGHEHLYKPKPMTQRPVYLSPIGAS